MICKLSERLLVSIWQPCICCAIAWYAAIKVTLAILLTFVELHGQTLLDAVSADESLGIFLAALRTHGQLQKTSTSFLSDESPMVAVTLNLKSRDHVEHCQGKLA